MVAIALANNRGGAGKTTLVTVIAQRLAAKGKKVVVIDVSRFGDASRALLGGREDGERRLREVPAARTAGGLFLAARTRAVGWSAYMPWNWRAAPIAFDAVSERVNDNLRVCIGTPVLADLPEPDERIFNEIVTSIKAAIAASDAIVIFDTDHEVGTWYGRVALAASDRIVVPISTSIADVVRLFYQRDALFAVLSDMGDCAAKVTHTIINNVPVTSFKETGGFDRGGERATLPFKVSAAAASDIVEVVGILDKNIPENVAKGKVKVMAFPTMPSSASNALQTGNTEIGDNLTEAADEIACSISK